MTEDQLLEALSKADRDLDDFPHWHLIKKSAAVLVPDDIGFTPGQLAVFALWRVFGLDAEGQHQVPSMDEYTEPEEVVKSLELFKNFFADEFGSNIVDSVDTGEIERLFSRFIEVLRDG